MLGTIVNAIAVILGAVLGVLIRKGIKEEYKNTIMDGIGLAVVIIGITSGITSENIILVISSIVIGGLIGEKIGIENKLENLGDYIEGKIGGNSTGFSKGFVTASLVYCIGAMAIVGSLEAGIQGNYETLFAKSILDGISAIIFASTLGIGVAFSSLSVFLYQGSITLLANLVKDLLTTAVITEMSAVGGILIMAIGINILGIKKIRIGNMLPAIFIPVLYYVIVSLIDKII